MFFKFQYGFLKGFSTPKLSLIHNEKLERIFTIFTNV